MIKRPLRKLTSSSSQVPVCTNVFNYGAGDGSSGTLSRLVPASEIGLSSSGNTIGVLNTSLVPSKISNPTRLLFGLPTSLQLSSDTLPVPVPLSVAFSTSADVDIVQSVSPGVLKSAGTQGFYFRNELPSDYYIMVGSYLVSGESTFKQRAVIVAVPQGVSPATAQISSVPGFVANFTMAPGEVILDTPKVINPNTYFRVSFDISTPVAVGALQPLTTATSAVLGNFVASSVSGMPSATFVPKVEQVTFVCFS